MVSSWGSCGPASLRFQACGPSQGRSRGSRIPGVSLRSRSTSSGVIRKLLRVEGRKSLAIYSSETPFHLSRLAGVHVVDKCRGPGRDKATEGSGNGQVLLGQDAPRTLNNFYTEQQNRRRQPCVSSAGLLLRWLQPRRSQPLAHARACLALTRFPQGVLPGLALFHRPCLVAKLNSLCRETVFKNVGLFDTKPPLDHGTLLSVRGRRERNTRSHHRQIPRAVR